MAFKLSEDESRFWDMVAKVVGGIAAVVTLIIGFMTLYGQGENLKTQQAEFELSIKQQQESLKTQQAEFEKSIKQQDKALNKSHEEEIQKLGEEYHRRFWEKRVDLYAEASNAASMIASLQLFPGKDFRQDEYSQALRRFYQLYYGELCLVESEEVETAMITFKNTLEASPRPTPDAAYVTSLLDASIDLAHACSASLRSDWDLPPAKLHSPEELSKASPLGEVPIDRAEK
jgi:hypothetical protein